MTETVIDAADLLLYRDGRAELVLMGARPGDPVPRTVPLTLDADEGRALLAWLRRRGRVGMGEVWRQLGRVRRRPYQLSGMSGVPPATPSSSSGP